MEKATPPSWSSTLGEYPQAINGFLALLIGLKSSGGMKKLISLFVVFLLFYYGLCYAANKLKSGPGLGGYGKIMYYLSISCGTLAWIFEVLLVVQAYGSVPLFLWCFFIVGVVVAVLVLVLPRLDLVELKDKLMWIKDNLIGLCGRLYVRNGDEGVELSQFSRSDGLDEKLAKEKAINDWLPITSSRNAKWWYSAFHNVTAMVGAGVLGLPYAMAELGWGPGITILVLSWVITLYTLWQMVEMHEMVPGKRFDRYHELGQHAFGEKLGLYIVVHQQLIVEVGVCIVYMVTGGTSLKKVHDTMCTGCKQIKLTYFIMIFASVHFVLSHLPNFNSISGVSLAAAVMSLSYSTIAWTAALDKGVIDNVDYDYKSKTTTGNVFNFFAALGEVAFAYAGHNVVLEIQATIPSTPEKPSKVPMWKGVIVAYIVVALCYFPVALVGYYIYGNSVEDNILVSLEKPKWLIVTANMFVVVHVIGSYQIYAMPVFDMMETLLVKKLGFRPTFNLRFVTRTSYVAITMFLGITFPFFSGLLSFFGGFAFAPTTYFLPCIMWLAIYKPKMFSLSWCCNYICIFFGLLLMILSPIGGLRTIIVQAKTYQFYS